MIKEVHWRGHRLGNLAIALTGVAAISLPAAAQDEPALGEAVDAGSRLIEAITVTARRRDERLIDVPVSVSAISGEQLEQAGFADATDLFGHVPGLYFSSSVVTPARDTTFLVIRGVGANTGGEPSAAIFVDGVYTPSLGFDTGFVDLERIELLRGPQGALFGRNTQAGALNIITRRPDDTFRAKVSAEFDEFESAKVQGALSGPITDVWSVGLSGEVYTTEGYLSNVEIGRPAGGALGDKTFEVAADDHQRHAARIGLRYRPSEAVDAYLTADWSRRAGNAAFPGVPHDCRCYEVRNEFQLDQVSKDHGLALNLDVDFETIRLTSITGARFLDNRGPFDFDGGPEFTGNYYDLRSEQHLYSQEIKLASTGSAPLQWTAGIYAFKESNEQDRDFYLPDLDTIYAGIDVASQIIENRREGFALYGQLIYKLTDRLELSGGLRSSREKVKNRADVEFTIPLIGFGVDFLDTPSSSFDSVTGSASLSYRIADSWLVYASFAQGFKAGGYQKTTATRESNLPFDSETSDNYEMGLKGSAFDSRLAIELSAFRVNIDEQQLQTVVLIQGNIPVSAIDNAGKSHTQGFEASVGVSPIEGLALNANVGYVEARYDRYVNEDGVHRAGDPFPYVPEWTFGVTADHRAQLAQSTDLILTAGWRHIDGYQTGTGTSVDPFFDIDSQSRVDIRVGVQHGNWSASLFVDNLLDSYDVSSVWNAYFFAGNSRNFDQVLPPRRIGVRIGYSF